MKALFARLCWLLAAGTMASPPLSAQRISPAGVVQSRIDASELAVASSVHAVFTAVLPSPNDVAHRSIGQVAVTILGAGIGAFVGVASVEIYKQANGKSSCSCDHSADYTGATIGVLTLGGVAWLLGGKWFD